MELPTLFPETASNVGILRAAEVAASALQLRLTAVGVQGPVEIERAITQTLV
jgi:hypothetical protein